jgi:hypothetical protein
LYQHLGTGETDIPPIDFPADGDGLDCALYGARPPHGKTPDLRQDQEAVVKPYPILKLGIGEAVIAFTPMEPWIAGCLPFTDALEKHLECSIYTQDHILQDLAMDLAILRHDLLDTGKLGLLLVVGDRDAAFLPRFPPFAKGGIVEMTA